MENTTVSMYPPTGSEVQERKDEVIKALAEIETLQEQKRLANAEYQMKIKEQKQELQANMDWLKSKGIFELEEMPDMEGIELSYKAY